MKSNAKSLLCADVKLNTWQGIGPWRKHIAGFFMLTSRQYIDQIIKYRHAGRPDLVESIAKDRYRTNRALRNRHQLSLDIGVGEAADIEPRPTVTAPI